jgi:hypothetical protein
MKRGFRILGTGLLVSLAAVLVAGIVSLHDWGGRIETLMMVFGDRVWVTIDVGRPRFWCVLLIPGAMVGAALSLRAWRPDE